MKKALAFLLMLTTALSLLSLAGCRKKGKEEEPMNEAEETEDCGYQIYVSPDGNDKNDGSIGSPLATPDGARLLLNEKQPEKSTVWLRGGTYSMTDKIGFTVFDYSKAGSSTFGSTYLINALPRQMDSYKASLVRVYNSARTKAIANRSAETTAALKEAYEALNK